MAGSKKALEEGGSKGVQQQASGRKCRLCTSPLSIYNPEDTCYACQRAVPLKRQRGTSGRVTSRSRKPR